LRQMVAWIGATARILAIVCLGSYLAARADAEFGRAQGIAAFQAAGGQSPATASGDYESVAADQAHWSAGRIHAYLASLASDTGMPIGLLRVADIDLVVPVCPGTGEQFHPWDRVISGGPLPSIVTKWQPPCRQRAFSAPASSARYRRGFLTDHRDDGAAMTASPAAQRPSSHRRVGRRPDLAAPREPFQQTVSRTIERLLATRHSTIAAVARELSMNVRTLHCRRRQAVQELTRGTYSISEVSARLGYSDPAHFARAFRRWTGRSPTEYSRPARTPGR